MQRRLLTTKEVADLDSQVGGCSKGMRCLIWATQTIAASGATETQIKHLNEQVVLLRRSLAYIWSWDDQMLPFAYVHAMNVFILIVMSWKSLLSGFDAPAVLHGDYKAVWGFLIVLTNFVWAFAILVLREVSHVIADPFSHSKNGINIERYLDLHVSGTSALLANHEQHPVDPTQDPNFSSMATTDKATWRFQERPTRDVTYLHATRKLALRLKSTSREALLSGRDTSREEEGVDKVLL